MGEVERCSEGEISEPEEARLGRVVRDGERAAARLRAGAADAASSAGLEALVGEGQIATTRLVAANLGLVEAIARRYRTRRMSHRDLVQEGAIGLLRAVQRFDPERGRLGPYAAWWIREAITKALVDGSRIIRLPPRVARSLVEARRTQSDLEARWGRAPTRDELAAALGTTPERVARTLAYAHEPLSMSSGVGGLGHSSLADLVEDRSATSPAEQAERTLLGRSVTALLAVLEPRERLVLQLRYGLDGARCHTLAEIGTVLGLTRQRVGQIEARVLVELRREL